MPDAEKTQQDLERELGKEDQPKFGTRGHAGASEPVGLPAEQVDQQVEEYEKQAKERGEPLTVKDRQKELEKEEREAKKREKES